MRELSSRMRALIVLCASCRQIRVQAITSRTRKLLIVIIRARCGRHWHICCSWRGSIGNSVCGDRASTCHWHWICHGSRRTRANTYVRTAVKLLLLGSASDTALLSDGVDAPVVTTMPFPLKLLHEK